MLLTADMNFVRVLDRIAEQAPIPVGRAYRVAPVAHNGIVEAIEATLSTL